MKHELIVQNTVDGAEILTDEVCLLTLVKDLGTWNTTNHDITKHGL